MGIFGQATSDSAAGTYECCSCGDEMDGFTWRELEGEGWKRFSDTPSSRAIELCGRCVMEFEVRRELAQLPASV